MLEAPNPDIADIIADEGCPLCWAKWDEDAQLLLDSIDWKEKTND